MSQRSKIDTQAIEINKGLTKLFELLEKPVARNALDLAKNAESSSKYDVLRRLRQSLRQYVGREGELFYVGFLGHFSAGKSSTINALLRSNSSGHLRNTGLHPTDTTITLLTKAKNTDSILRVVHEGNVVIRQQPVEHPLLERVVIADTPGTGDPQLIEEIARDFLPICDLVLFLFSAATPVDKSDIPLLIELNKRLPFVPVHFVITRADELRSDPNQLVSALNLDAPAVSAFLSDTIVRLHSLLKGSDYTSDHFTLIDNKAGFNIDALRDFVEERCYSSSVDARANMQTNKLQFYRSSAKELRDFFLLFLDAKLTQLNKVLTTAIRNIDRYQQVVQITNNNLTRAWLEHNTSIVEAVNRANESIKPIVTLPADYSLIPTVLRKRTDLQNELRREARYLAGSISATLRSRVNAKLQDHFYHMLRLIAERPIEQLSASSYSIESVQLLVNFKDLEVIPATLLSRGYNDLRASQADSFRDTSAVLRRYLRTFQELSQQRLPLSDCEQVLSHAQETLKKDLTQFFQNVELYRNGVFSLSTKESIATLGIAHEMDALEENFTDDDKLGLTDEATKELFPGFENSAAQLSTRLSDLAAKSRVLFDSANALSSERPLDSSSEIALAAGLARVKLQNEFTSEIQSDGERLCGNVGTTVANLIIEAKYNYDAAVRNIDSLRRRRLLNIAGITALLVLGAELGYHFLRLPAPTSLVGTSALAIATGLGVEGIVLAIARIRENAPKLIADTGEKVRAKLNTDLREAVDLVLRASAFATLEQNALTTRLFSTYEHTIAACTDAWHARAIEINAAIRGVETDYSALRTEYLSLTDEVRQQCSTFFTDASRNLEILNSVANGIKARAIEPSFALLDRTQKQLEFVKEEMAAVEFS